MIKVNITLFVLMLSITCLADNQITQAQFIHKILAQEKLLAEAQIGLDIKKIEMNASRDNYQNWSIDLSAKTSYSYYDLERETDSNRSYIGNNKNYPKFIGLLAEKRFLNHRGSIKIGVTRVEDRDLVSSYKKSIETGEYQTDEAQNTQFIRYQYPLLKHDSNASSLRAYHLDIIDLKRRKLLFFETKEAVLRKQLVDYFSWIALHNRQLIQQSLLDSLNQIMAYNSKDRVVLQKTIFETKIDLNNVVQRLNAIKSKIAILLEDNDILSAVPSANLSVKGDIVERDILPKYLQKYSRVLERIRLDIMLKEINIAYYQNRALPSLNFSLEVENTDNKRHTKSNTFNDDRLDYKAALTFSVPLGGDILNTANLKKNKLSVKKIQISYQDKQQDILADVDSLSALLVVNENELVQNIENSKQSLALEKRSYALQKSSMRDLIVAYQEFAQAKLLKLNTLVDYQIRYIRYQTLLDRLITLGCPNGLADCTY